MTTSFLSKIASFRGSRDTSDTDARATEIELRAVNWQSIRAGWLSKRIIANIRKYIQQQFSSVWHTPHGSLSLSTYARVSQYALRLSSSSSSSRFYRNISHLLSLLRQSSPREKRRVAPGVREWVICEIGARPVAGTDCVTRVIANRPAGRSMNTGHERAWTERRVSLETGLKEDKRENEINLWPAWRSRALEQFLHHWRQTHRFPHVSFITKSAKNSAYIRKLALTAICIK